MAIGIVLAMVALVPVVYLVAGRWMAEPEKSTVAPPPPLESPRNVEPFTLEQPALVPQLAPPIDVAALRALPLPRFAHGSIPPGFDADTDEDDFLATDLDEEAVTLRDGQAPTISV